MRYYEDIGSDTARPSSYNRLTTSGMMISFRNCSSWSNSRALNVGAGYLIPIRGHTCLTRHLFDTYDRYFIYFGSLKYCRYFKYATNSGLSNHFWAAR